MLVRLETRKDYGEGRWIGIGKMINGVISVLVFTERNPGIIRVISMRKASKKERKNYEKNIEN